MSDYDVIVIGGGPSGLAEGNIATKAGKKTLILEMNDTTGGMGGSFEPIPGYTFNVGAYYMMFDDAKSFFDMHGIPEDEVELIRPEELGISYGDPKLPPMLTFSDPMSTMEYVAEMFGKDVMEGYAAFGQFMAPITAAMKMAMHNPPMSMAQIMDTMPSIEAKDALRKIFYGSISDLLDEFLPYSERSTVVRGLIYQNATGWFYGSPSDPGSCLSAAYLAGVTSDTSLDAPMAFPKGTMGALMQAATRAFIKRGGEVRLNSEVAKIIIRDGKACGVQLADGTEITGDVIVSSLDAGNTFGRCCDPADLDPGFVKRIKELKHDESICQFFIALNDLPSLRDDFGLGLNDTKNWYGQIVLNDEKLYEPNWYKIRYENRVPVEFCCGGGTAIGVLDRDLCPEGKYSMTFCNNYVWPHKVNEEDVPSLKEQIKASVIRSYSKAMPDFADCVDQIEVFTPYDYEKHYHVSGGNWTHGPLSFTNMLNFRPMLGMCDYRGPVDNLYLCGSSNHPGPGVSGIAATNCWNAIKSDKGWA